MYTEKSVELKSDFYSRYGTASGVLYFERVGLPFVFLRGAKSVLAFSAACGVRAYGRRCGDVIKVLDADSNVCDVRFAGSGEGAQILYKTDIAGFGKSEETVSYAVRKLMARMGVGGRFSADESACAFCDAYGSGGWCAYLDGGRPVSVPLPLTDHNIIVIRVRKNGGRRADAESVSCFEAGEDRRAEAAAAGLRDCRPEILFNMMNESQNALERLLPVSSEARAAVAAARETDGVRAARICGSGVMCVTDKEKTDSAVHMIRERFGREAGYYAGIVVIK